jgi:glutathione S-transferase
MIVIHGVPVSVHTRKVIVAALLKHLEHRVEPVVPFNPPAGWDKLSPTGLIPVIEHDGFALADSTAICHYFERLQPTPPLLPSSAQDVAHTQFLDAYAGLFFREVVHGLFFQRVIRPGILGQATNEDAVRAILAEKAPRMIGYLETQAGSGRLSADRMSLADIAVSSNLVNYIYLGFSLGAYPQLAAFLEAIVQHPAFAQALAVERPFADQMGLRLSM